MLFSSDDTLRRAQRAVTKHGSAADHVTAEQLRRETIEDARELREHQRLREFAFLLFVAPVIGGIVIGVAQWIGIKLLLSGMGNSLLR